MKNRILPRALFLTVVLVLFAVGAVLAWFQSWKSGRLVELDAGSQLAQLPAGTMEFTRLGDGPAVLVFHDALGGYDQGVALAGFLADQGFEVLIPSRPGYLRTPLPTGLTPEDQADAAAQLLDSLAIANVSVLGFGWGGPTALEFARRFSQRTQALVFVGAAVARENPPPTPLTPFPEAVSTALTGDVGSWLFVKLSESRPARALSAAYALTSTGGAVTREAWTDLVLSNPEQLEHFREIILSLAPIDPRESGLRNDLLQIRALPDIPLKDVATPVLLVHGGLDKAISITPIEAAQSQFPNAELLLLPDEGHLVFLGRSAAIARARITDFLKKHTAAIDESATE